MRSPRAIVTLVLLGLVLASVLNPNAEPTVQAQGKYTVYLPITRAAASAVTPPSGAGAQATFWLPYTQPDQSVIATSAPSIAVDGHGGVHIAYKVAAAASATTWPAYYTYCASDCASPARWSRVALGANAIDARVLVDQAGHPRLMIYAYASSTPFEQRKIYQFAACDTSCTSAEGWQLTTVTDSVDNEMYRSEHVHRYFALDHQGRPAFVYTDMRSEHDGTFYAACTASSAAACTNIDNWNEAKLSDGWFKWGELAFTPDDMPRLMMEYDAADGKVKLVYIECVSTCMTFAGTTLFDTDGYASWSLQLDRSGRPRAVVYTGRYVYDVEPGQILYVWCDTNCSAAEGWSAHNLHAASSSGWSVQLQLDIQDRPRFVYKQGDVAPGYAWCDANCESESGAWKSTQIESRDLLNRDFPAVPIVDCSIATWTSGHIPVLALDGQGNPRTAFVAMHQYAGTDTRPGHIGEPCPVQTDIELARYSMFPQP